MSKGKEERKVKKVMREYKEGELHSSFRSKKKKEMTKKAALKEHKEHQKDLKPLLKHLK